MTLFKIKQSVRILFGLCEFCSTCANCVNCANLFGFYIVCEFCSDCANCANCAKSCSNFRTQKEQNKEQGPVRFFCANFLFVLKEQNITTMSTLGSLFVG